MTSPASTRTILRRFFVEVEPAQAVQMPLLPDVPVAAACKCQSPGRWHLRWCPIALSVVPS